MLTVVAETSRGPTVVSRHRNVDRAEAAAAEVTAREPLGRVVIVATGPKWAKPRIVVIRATPRLAAQVQQEFADVALLGARLTARGTYTNRR